ncbi:kinase-like domain-containing protein [Tricharina praecox]|uniref:kinase-like domain-containing protein n=1 Tax=Tricharina praecox TaxID=43433 RepID=UPI00221F8373|nr:kinase-like domain-containing protein [Tricharina praecox]KAI5849905.1 kinase-like domain-containing protein [Tricharina praecox]
MASDLIPTITISSPESSPFNDETDWEAQWQTENKHMYQPGGFHPVIIGDILNDRYVIENKLGHGGFSTVWVAVDTLHQDRLIALKISYDVSQQGQHTTTETPMDREAEFLRRLGSSHQHPQRSSEVLYFPLLFDAFTIHGPNGVHRCIWQRLSVPTAKNVVVSIARAVAELHRHSIVHADLHPGNILMVVPGMESWTVTEFRRHMGMPMKRFMSDESPWFKWLPSPSPHVPEYLVVDAPLPFLGALCRNSGAIKITDFGMAFDFRKDGTELGELERRRTTVCRAGELRTDTLQGREWTGTLGHC